VVFGIPHGRAVGISLVSSLEYIASNPFYPGAPDPIDRLATAARFIGIEGKSSSDTIQQFLDKIDRLKQEIHEPLTMEETGISKNQLEEHLEELVQLAEKDVNMYSSPCECAGNSLKILFLRIWSGRKAMQ
jgi:alcohol dehydrogenase class IV